MGKRSALKFDELPDACESIFCSWGGHPEWRWAKKAWRYLKRSGLTYYADDLERQLVLIRFLALASVYGEFGEKAWDERFEPEYVCWAEEIGIIPFRIGQLVGSKFNLEEMDDYYLLEDALTTLVDDARPEIFASLIDGFGGESMLFVSLWTSLESRGIKDEGEIWAILNSSLTTNKLSAFEWITQGMLRIR